MIRRIPNRRSIPQQGEKSSTTRSHEHQTPFTDPPRVLSCRVTAVIFESGGFCFCLCGIAEWVSLEDILALLHQVTSWNLDGTTLMLSHSRHTSVLTTLSLHAIICITNLLLRHITTLRNTTRHAAMVGRKGGNIFRRFGDIASLDAILVTRWFWSVETCLQRKNE